MHISTRNQYSILPTLIAIAAIVVVGTIGTAVFMGIFSSPSIARVELTLDQARLKCPDLSIPTKVERHESGGIAKLYHCADGTEFNQSE